MSRLSIASVSMNMPTAKRPEQGIFVRRRLAAMAAHADVRALHAQPWFPLLQSFDRSTTDLEFNVTGQPFLYIPFFLKRFDSWWMRRAIRPVLERWHGESSLDLIDAHFGYPTGVACYHVGRQLGIPTFITLRGVEASQLRHPAVGRQMVDALQGCAGVIAVSHSLKDAAIEAGVDSDRVQVIPNGVDGRVFCPGDRYDARIRLGLPADAPIIVSVGSLIERKGFHLLLPAFAELRRAYPKSILVIVGGPSHEISYPQKISRLIRELNLQQAVRLPGAVPPDEVATWLQAADLFCLVSSREGCCNAVLEALACGVPVVATPVGDNSKYVQAGKTGLVVPLEHMTDLSATLSMGLAHKWDSSEIVRQTTKYSWSDAANECITYMHSRLRATRNSLEVSGVL